MIRAHFPAGSKEGTVLESDTHTFKVGDAVKLTLPGGRVTALEQPVVLHGTTNHKVRNFTSRTLEDGSLEANWELRDAFTFE